MRRVLPFLLPALVLPLSAAEPLPLAQRLQQVLRLPEADLARLQADLAAASDRPAKAYWLALVAYARLGQTQDPARGAALLAEALACLEGRTDAESLALKGSLCGMAIGLHPEQAMELAPRALECFQRARQVDPGNPRVRFFEAVHQFHTPEAFGGGPGVALPLLAAALQQADREPPTADPWRPTWGKVECLAWLALAEAKTGDLDSARKHLVRCLRLDPGYGFAHQFVEPLLNAGGKP
jgi:tetratricopeptide (TPR) repeat protein